MLRFNSRAREGRDCISLLSAAGGIVSIHAPARGATRKGEAEIAEALVSIHAPARGATNSWGWGMRSIGGFNSRAREGRDEPDKTTGFSKEGFNSRAREGRDRRGAPHRESPSCFNSRAREGRDRPALGMEKRLLGFNSRAREGRDWSCRRRPCACTRFQFTRPRGARLSPRPRPPATWGCFNSRAREGRDAPGSRCRQEQRLFQFTRPRGARPAAGGHSRFGLFVSIHAPARGATRMNELQIFNNEVSIHAPARGATSDRRGS